MNAIKCTCDETIVKSEDGAFKIRSKILVVRGNNVFAVCKSCSSEVRVPLAPTAVAPAGAALPHAGPRLILQK